jgi:hypothetical protein
MQPLSVDALSARAEGDIDTTDLSLPTHELLQRVRRAGRWRLVPSTQALLPHLTQTQRRRITHPPRSPAIDAADPEGENELPVNILGVQVALVIAMPVPPDVKICHHDGGSDAQETLLLRDFAIGTTYLPL